MKRRRKMNKDKAMIACNLIGADFSKYSLREGRYYRVSLTDEEFNKVTELYQNKRNDTRDAIDNTNSDKLLSILSEREIDAIINSKENSQPISTHEIVGYDADKDRSVGILLMSDWHIDETVKPDTVLGKNEYNKEIAKKRIDTFFFNAVKMLKKKHLDELVIASLGDMIGGFIHDELMQTNSMTPMNGISLVKECMLSGLKYVRENTDIPITFIGICGNHSRTTKKMQFANGFELSYEYFMYKDIESVCGIMGIDIKFIIPQSEFAYIDCLGRKLLMCHGHQFRYAGGIGGVFVPMLRWFAKMNQIMTVDKAFIGHYHSSIYTKNVIVNGSIKGYDAFAMGKALPYEEPQQTFIVLNEKRGFIFYTPIFCD